MVWHGGCDGQLIRAGERRHLRLKHTGDDRYGPRADCRRHRLVAQAAQRESFEPPLSGHPHERSAQTDDARPRGGEEPPRIEVQRRQRVLREGPEETKQLSVRELQHCDRGASCAPNPFTRAYSTSTLLALTTIPRPHSGAPILSASSRKRSRPCASWSSRTRKKSRERCGKASKPSTMKCAPLPTAKTASHSPASIRSTWCCSPPA